MIDDPAKKPDTRAPVNENEEFCCVFTTTMNNKRLMYGAEMDGIESREAFDLETADLNEHKLAELKVSIMAREEKQLDRLHRFKYRNWWCQCYLTKVRKVTVGTRNKRGIVTEVSQVSMGEMARLGKVNCEPRALRFVFWRAFASEMLRVRAPIHLTYWQRPPDSFD